ncbi:MAG: hypothetical protein JWM57_484, partial [Phycisphaerales bacterium]|nr:hypothetical protein [Phycisphaerales bacterium]
MATPREIRIKLRIDDAGIPIDLKKITDLIGNTFDKAGQNMAASFEKAAERVVASVANIGRATKSVSMLDGTKIVDRGASPSTGFTRTGAIIEPNRGASVAATGPAAITNYLSQGGFRPVSDRLTMDASGTKSTTQYRNAAGGIATLNNETQKLTTTVPRAQTYWERFKRSLATPLGSGSALGFVGDLAAKVYLIQAAFAGIDRLAIAPIKRLADQFIEATEASRKFELAIGGVTGLGRARQLNYGLVSASRNQPTDVAGLRQTGSTFAALPALAGKLNDPNAIAQIVGLNRTVARLGTLDPEQGQQGATTAIRELLEGGGGGDAFNSLRRRFGLSASTLSKAIGRTVDDIKADPALALKAVQKITDTLVPDSIVDQSGQLFSVKIQKIRDALDAAMARVGDSGAFDHLTQKVDGVAQQLFAALDSAKFQTQARKVSDAVSRAVDSIGSSVERFLRGATGARPDQPLVEVIGDALAAGVERLANIIDNLPAIADKI